MSVTHSHVYEIEVNISGHDFLVGLAFLRHNLHNFIFLSDLLAFCIFSFSYVIGALFAFSYVIGALFALIRGTDDK